MKRQRVGRIFLVDHTSDGRASSDDADVGTLFLVIVIACLTTAALALGTAGCSGIARADQINLMGPLLGP